jgi:hypothetical protein
MCRRPWGLQRSYYRVRSRRDAEMKVQRQEACGYQVQRQEACGYQVLLHWEELAEVPTFPLQLQGLFPLPVTRGFCLR